MIDLQSGRIGWTGAEAILDPALMLGSQRRILKSILLHIDEIADSEAKREGARRHYGAEQLRRRPHQVFLIDGARGSGKTTLLLTLQQYLKLMGRPKEWQPDRLENELAVNFLQNYATDIESKLETEEGAASSRTRRFNKPHDAGDKARRSAYFLPVLFPSDLEFGQSIMEGVLALVAGTLNDAIARYEKDATSEHKGRIKEANELLTDIHTKVAAGWFLSRNTGIDAMLRDSADYEDFLTNRGIANVKSFSRVPTWRHFLNRYLDFFQSELLVVFFDDTDVATAVSRDILHTVRIFLDHPRVVTVIAGNLHSIRQSLVLDEMKTLGGPIEALTAEAEATARDWRRLIRQEVEESLEKVLPRRFRFYISTTHERASRQRDNSAIKDHGGTGRDQSTKPPSAKSDFESIFGETFDDFCGRMLNYWRKDFLAARHRSHFRWLEDRQEIWDEDEERQLENYLSWWLFRHWYADRLQPKTVRHMAALRAYTIVPKSSGLAIDRLREEHKKRLAVILFESPENFEIVHRLGDGDQRVQRWLHRQTVESSWNGDRYIAINGRRIYENTYSYHFLFYRLDLGVALPVQENPQETLPLGILPSPDGPNLARHRAFFTRSRQQKLFGVAEDLSHSLIPGNCIYLFDIDALPDAAWQPLATNSIRETWERRLLYGWKQLFFFDLEELRSDSEPELSTSADTGGAPQAVVTSSQIGQAGLDPPQPVGIADESTSVAGQEATVTADASSEVEPAAGTTVDPMETSAPPLPQPIIASAREAGQTQKGANEASAGAGAAGMDRDPHEEEKSINFKEAWVSDYFVHTVVPLASMQIGKYVGSDREFSSRIEPIADVADLTLLHAELERTDSPFFASIIGLVDNMLRRHDYLQNIASGPDSRSVVPQSEELLDLWGGLILDRVFPEEMLNGQSGSTATHATADEDKSAAENAVLKDLLRGRHRTTPTERRAALRGANSAELDRLAKHLISYRWLVNDVRRSWHAARIFLNQVSGTLKNSSAVEMAPPPSGTSPHIAPEVTRRDRFFRSDRYTIGTREALDRWLQRSETLKHFFALYGARSTEELELRRDKNGFYRTNPTRLERQVRDDLLAALEGVDKSHLPAWGHAENEWKLDSQQLKAIFAVRRSHLGKSQQTAFLAFDPFDHEGSEASGHGDTIEIMRSRTYSRLARSTLLFLYGFAPNLPSLIHLEIAAALHRSAKLAEKNPRSDADLATERENMHKILRAWRRRTMEFMSFVDDYRRLLEFNQIKLDIMELWRLAYPTETAASAALAKLGINTGAEPQSFGVWMSLTPDMSFGSIGIRGLAGLPKLRFADLPELEKQRFEKDKLWKENGTKKGRVVWNSVIDMAFDSLVEALNFIKVTQHVIDQHFQSCSSAEKAINTSSPPPSK